MKEIEVYKSDLSKKEFSIKIALFIAIIIVFTIFVLLMGMKYGYSKGVSVSIEYYDEYIETYCICGTEPVYTNKDKIWYINIEEKK